MQVMSPLLVSPLCLLCQLVCKYRAGIAADHERVWHLPQTGFSCLARLAMYIPITLQPRPWGQESIFCLSLGLTHWESTCDTEQPELSHLPSALCGLE